MKKRLLLTTLATLVAVITVFAVPAKPGLKKKVTLKDGTTVELSLKGDEHFSYYTDAKGVPCLLKNGQLVTMTSREVAETWASRKQQRLSLTDAANSHRAARRAGKPSKTTTGNQRGLVILLQYTDVKFTTSNPQQIFQRFFNEENYSEGGMAGSVRDYFHSQSYGKLTIDFDVVGPFTTKQKMEYYGKPVKDKDGKVTDHDVHPVLMVAEAVDSAYKAGVDFSKYDWDNDGEVDQVFVIYAGYAEAQGADENTIWPHEYVLAAENATRKYNNVTINTYGCASELMGNSGTTMDGIGTACHEFSHCLGLPDMYDTSDEGTNFGMSCWDIMDRGSYNRDACVPAGYTSYERWFSGWMEPVELKEETQISDMKPLATDAEAYILYNEKDKNEYYLLENRQPVGFDAGLYGHGLLILHVDYSENAWTSNTVNNVESHQRMTIIPADNEFNSNYASSLAGDPWPGTSGNTMLGNHTTPAATLYNANTDGTKLMNKAIMKITENTEAHTVSFVACRPEIEKPDVSEATEVAGENSFTVTWPAVTGAASYELELTTIDKAPSTPEEALKRKYDFAKFESKTTGFTDISSKLAEYGLDDWTGSKLYTTPNKLRIGTSTTTGTLKTPWWYTPSSTNATLVMGVDVVKSGTTVKGSINVSNADVNEEGYIRNATDMDPVNFEVTGNQKLILYLKDMRKVAYQFQIAPSAQMYLNYLAIYDGIWTAEQLGISNSAAQAPRRATTVTTFTSNTNSYTFTDLDTNKRFIYRIRAVDEEGAYSAWSDEKEFEFSSTSGINTVNTKAVDGNAVRYFDLQGREVPADTKGLLIRKQGSEVKKVIVK